MEDKKLFTDYQFGSRPRRCYIDLVMIEELQNETNRILRKSQIKANLDAIACYDRIIPGFAILASQKYGMHKNVCIVQATTLEEAKYHLRKQHIFTEEFYQHCQAYPIYGTRQGSGSSPMLWIIISSIRSQNI